MARASPTAGWIPPLPEANDHPLIVADTAWKGLSTNERVAKEACLSTDPQTPNWEGELSTAKLHQANRWSRRALRSGDCQMRRVFEPFQSEISAPGES